MLESKANNVLTCKNISEISTLNSAKTQNCFRKVFFLPAPVSPGITSNTCIMCKAPTAIPVRALVYNRG